MAGSHSNHTHNYLFRPLVLHRATRAMQNKGTIVRDSMRVGGSIPRPPAWAIFLRPFRAQCAPPDQSRCWVLSVGCCDRGCRLPDGRWGAALMSKGHVAVGSEAKEFILLHKGSRTIAVIGRYGRGIYVAHTGLDNVFVCPGFPGLQPGLRMGRPFRAKCLLN